MSSADSLHEAIQAWTRRHSGTWSEAHEKKLQTWLAATAEHREAYEKVARAWGRLPNPHQDQTPGNTLSSSVDRVSALTKNEDAGVTKILPPPVLFTP